MAGHQERACLFCSVTRQDHHVPNNFREREALNAEVALSISGKNTYNEFLKSEEKIATNVLADRLAMLEIVGILVKEEHPESKAKIFYRLSARGIDLLPVLVEIILWSDKHLAISPQAKQFVKQLRKDKETVVKQISYGLKKR